MTKFINIGDRVRLSTQADPERRIVVGDMCGTVSELNDWGARVDWDTPNPEWNGPEYHEIELAPEPGKFNIGDRVRVINGSVVEEYNGHPGTVRKINAGEDYPYEVDFDDPAADGTRKWDTFRDDEIELVPARRIPVGTRVRVISREAYAGAYFGREGVVNRDDGTSIVPYRVSFGGETARSLFDYDDLEVITVPNPAAQFNIGDRVRLSRHASSARRFAVGTREGIIESFGPTSGMPVVDWLPYPIPSYNNPPFAEIELVNPPTPDVPDPRAVADEKRRRVTDLRDQAGVLYDQAQDLFNRSALLAAEIDTIERAAAIIEASK